jgi:hypothetical protein
VYPESQGEVPGIMPLSVLNESLSFSRLRFFDSRLPNFQVKAIPKERKGNSRTVEDSEFSVVTLLAILMFLLNGFVAVNPKLPFLSQNRFLKANV